MAFPLQMLSCLGGGGSLTLLRCHSVPGCVCVCLWVCTCIYVCVCLCCSVIGSNPRLLSLCSDSVDETVDRWSLQKISLLREIAMKTGIQV